MLVQELKGYLSVALNVYYEGDKLSADDVEVPRRPSYLYRWDAVTKDWVLDATAKIAADDADIIAQISAKELTTLRPLRELLRSQLLADVAPAVVVAAKAKLKQVDDDIAALRAQLK